MNGVQLVLVLVGSLAVTAVARRLGWQSPLLVVLVGLAASYLPGLARFELSPDLILGAVVPPLIYSSALKFSVYSFKRMLWPIFSLGVLLVVVTQVVVGPVAAGVTGMAATAGLVLGAVVAPPDAVSAASIGRQLALPRSLMTILNGESLINDAMALTLFSLSVAAVTGTHMVFSGIVPLFLYGASVGVVVGLLIGVVVQLIRTRLDDPQIGTVIGLVVPFAAYLAAEEIHASGVIAVVAAGFSIGHNSAGIAFATRIQERDVFAALDMLLEALVFGYMGLQLRFVLQDLSDSGIALVPFLGAAGLILVVVIVIRIGYVWLGQLRSRLWTGYQRWAWSRRRARAGGRVDRTELRELHRFPWKYSMVLSWTGMRGVVTVAAAASIPATTLDGTPFPARAQIQGIAFVVAVGTLLIHGSTLPALIGKLRISDPQQLERDQAERDRAETIGREVSAAVLAEAVRDPPPGLDQPTARFMLERAQGVAQLMRAGPPGAERSGLPGAERSRPPGPERPTRSVDPTVGPIDHPARPKPPALPGLPGPLGAAGPAAGPFAASRNFRAASAQAMAGMGKIRTRMLEAQRTALIAERDAGRLDDEILREVLETLDLEQAALESRLPAPAA